MHHRHQEDSTYNSLYGSFLQSFLYIFGGYDATDLFDTADSPMIMSLYFPLFVIVMVWILLLYLLVAMNEIFNETEFKAICLWRENQLRVILAKSLLLGEEISNNIFHQPKWLQILKPLQQQEFRSLTRADSCCCECGGEGTSTSTKESVDDIRRDVELLKDLFYQFQDTLQVNLRQQQEQQAAAARANASLGAGAEYNEAQLLEKIRLMLLHNNPLPAINVPSQLTVVRLPPKEEETSAPSPTPATHPPPLRARTMSRALSKTDETDLRPPNDPQSPSISNSEKKGKADSGIRVRQIKSSKKKLSSKILGLEFDES
jgi:hypothetical protein